GPRAGGPSAGRGPDRHARPHLGQLTMQQTESTAPADVSALRADLDVVDAEIRALVERRRELSREIQRIRQSAGGTRTDLARVISVISPYAEAYGRQGTANAMALLEICRGTGPAAREPASPHILRTTQREGRGVRPSSHERAPTCQVPPPASRPGFRSPRARPGSGTACGWTPPGSRTPTPSTWTSPDRSGPGSSGRPSARPSPRRRRCPP